MRSPSSPRSRAALAAAVLALVAAGVWGSACDLNPQPIPPGITATDGGEGSDASTNAPTGMGDDTGAGGGTFGDIDGGQDSSPVPPFEAGTPVDGGDAGDGGRLDAGDAGDGGDAQ